jgi:hypothetical protein
VVADLSAGRAVVRASFTVETFLPQDAETWEQAYRSFYR